MPGHYTNTASIVANTDIVAATLRGILDDLDDAVYAVDTSSAISLPPGMIIPYAGPTEPNGWLFCYGQNVSRTSYSSLFSVIGTTYGVGDGSTTFNLPDLRGRVPIAKDNMGGSSANRVVAVAADTLGGSGGAETHTLAIGEIPSHDHRVVASGNVANSSLTNQVSNGSGGGTWSAPQTGATGGSGSHNNMQPYLAINYLIKT